MPKLCKLLFQLNHPAHFHLFKNTIKELDNRGHKIKISIKDKDILKDLVKDFDFEQISKGYRKKGIISILYSVISRDKKLYKIAREFKPDLMIGTSPEIGHISPFLKIPSLFFGEDDVNLSLGMFLGALASYPLFNRIIAPSCVNNSIWTRKTTFYEGFQKLAYLHPNRFTPDRNKVEIKSGTKYFIIRFSSLDAYHDAGIGGLNNSLAQNLIDILSEKGEILISTERKLPNLFSQHLFRGNISDMHHYMAFADLFIGDSQTMAAEAGLLGTPFIRYNSFVGRIGYLNEIENNYKLGFGVKFGDEQLLFKRLSELIEANNRNIYSERRNKMLNEKIDVTAFYVWFIENYPKSITVMKENPNYQYKFQ